MDAANAFSGTAVVSADTAIPTAATAEVNFFAILNLDILNSPIKSWGHFISRKETFMLRRFVITRKIIYLNQLFFNGQNVNEYFKIG